MEFYLATKNENLSLSGKQMKLENLILSGLSGTEDQKSHVLPHMEDLDCRLKANVPILLDTGHTKGRPCTGGTEQRID
jgi:hypothetical protein